MLLACSCWHPRSGNVSVRLTHHVSVPSLSWVARCGRRGAAARGVQAGCGGSSAAATQQAEPSSQQRRPALEDIVGGDNVPCEHSVIQVSLQFPLVIVPIVSWQTFAFHSQTIFAPRTDRGRPSFS